MTNCLGGLYVGDNSCAEGHIGALCEECDVLKKLLKLNYQ